MSDSEIHRKGVETCPSCGGAVWHCSRCGAGPPGIASDSRPLSTAELSALFAVCLWDPRAYGIRDTAIIALLYMSELSGYQIATLDLRDSDQEGGLLTVRALHGQAEREVTLSEDAAAALRRWLAIRGSRPGPLFLAMNTYDRLNNQRLLYSSINDILRRRSQQAGIQNVRTRDLHYTHRLRNCLGPSAGSESQIGVEYAVGFHQKIEEQASDTGAVAFECLTDEALRRVRNYITSILLERGTTDPEIENGPGTQYGKGLPYPEETKLKVVEAVNNGITPKVASQIFGIGSDTAKRWVRTAREGGSLRPKRSARTPPVADPDAREWLAIDLEKHPGDTLLNRRERMWVATGVKPPVSSAIWKQIRLWGFVYADGRWIRP